MNLDAHEQMLQDSLDEMVRRGHAESKLPSFPSVPAPAGANELVDRCIGHARRLGLELPRFGYRFVRAPGEVRGVAAQWSDRSLHMILNLAELRDASDLAIVTFHELRHLADYARGNNNDVVAFERRARLFSLEAMDGFYL